jgi:Xaa-Pro dipeptidase
VVIVRPGETSRLLRLVPSDFWTEPLVTPAHPFAEVLDVEEFPTQEKLKAALGDVSKLAYVGDDPIFAGALDLPAEAIEPTVLLAALDWERAFKTPYEVECLRQASRRAGAGHAAVRAGVGEGISERALHFRYLEATGHLENETPYTNIIAWDAASAVLHYQSKCATAPEHGHSFLIDAGAIHGGYCSDITRTYAREGAHPTFAGLLDGMKGLQTRLVDEVRPGRPYVEIHEASFRGVSELLCDHGLLTITADEAFDKALAWPFYPHGVGHHLGLQVHDVGGRQVDPQGTVQPPPEQFPWLRTTRTLEPGHVVTIEPGLYVIPMLLAPYREGGEKGTNHGAFDWDLIDALAPCGGIRIEDDVAVTTDGVENLSRPFVPL